MQILVELNHKETLCFSTQELFDIKTENKNVKEICEWAIQKACRETSVLELQHYDAENDYENLSIRMENLSLSSSTQLGEESSEGNVLMIFLSTTTLGLGGKGGFGAQLRSLAKQKGKKQTTNFGACRDLQGRRLRHINDEIILMKWKESQEAKQAALEAAKARGGEKATIDTSAFDITEEQTASGIPLWFLSIPSWVDGIKTDKRKKFLKPRRKTTMCLDWLRAREDGKQPPAKHANNIHWGCPRGPRCDFAHGEDDLVGAKKQELLDEHEEDERDRRRKAKDEYLKPLHDALARDEVEMKDLISRGLAKERQNKRMKVEGEKEKETVKEEPDKSVKFVELVSGGCIIRYKHLEPTTGTTVDGQGESSTSVPTTTTSTAVNANEGLIALLTGNSTFSTAIAHGETDGLSLGTWYYEIELLSDGLMQLGWVTDDFLGGSNETGLGVGDDESSWAIDGFRRKAFHAGKEDEITFTGESESDGWKAGDVVGCYLQINPAKSGNNNGKLGVPVSIAHIWFTLNGNRCSKDYRVMLSSTATSFYPAFSLEQDESILVNTGYAQPWRYEPNRDGLRVRGVCGVGSVSREVLRDECVEEEVVLEEEGKKVEDQKKEGEREGETVKPVTVSEPVEFEPIHLESSDYATVAALEALGLDRLKFELGKRGLKVGGTLTQRAERLLAVRGVKPKKIDKRLLAK